VKLQNIKNHRYLMEFVWGVPASLVGIFLLFRSFFLHQIFPGDIGDARGNVLALDHWYRFFQGKEAIGQLLIFYPDKHALGNSDAFFVQGVFYSFFRTLHLNALSATIWAEIIFAFVGLCGFVLLSNLFFKNVFLKIASVILIANSYPLLAQVVHPQLFGYLTASWFFLGVLQFTKRFDKPNLGFLLIFITCELQALSCWYVLGTELLYALIFLIVYLLQMGHKDSLIQAQSLFRRVTRNVGKVSLLGWSSFLISNLILIAGWLLIYYPNIKNGVSKFSYADTSVYSPRYGDLLNTSSGSFGWWNKFFQYIHTSTAPTGERAMGYPPLLFTIFLLLVIALMVRPRTPEWMKLCRALIITNLLIVFIILTDDSGRSPWYIFYKLFPGAGSMRTLFRINILLTFVLLLVVIYILDHWIIFKPTTRLIPALFLLTMLFLESMRLYSGNWTANQYLPPYGKTIIQQMKTMHCHSFLLVAKSPQANPSFLQNDAGAISVIADIPTLNGSTSVFPKNYNLYGVTSENYQPALNLWESTMNLNPNSICVFER
jgi:hypothetical protein